MEVEIGRGKKARRAYGFDDIAIVPSRRTRDPDDIDISWKLGPYQFELPMLAAAMDGVVSPRTAGIIGGLGGLAVLNLEGIFTRYEDAEEQLERIAPLPKEIATRDAGDLLRAGQARADRPADREIKEQKVVVAASLTPQRVIKYHEIAMEAGLDVLVIQGTVVSGEHVSTVSEPLNLKEFIPTLEVPVVVGGCASSTRAAPDAHGRGGRARRRGAGGRVHDARRARHRRAAGDGDRGRRARALHAHARDRRVLPGDRRRRHAQRRRRVQGDRAGRRRRDDRLAAGARLRGARARLSLGHGDVPSDASARSPRRRPRTARSRRSSSGRRARTTARSTCSAGCARRWRRAGTRISRSSTAPRS